MRIIEVWIKKNGEHWEDGMPFIRDGLDNVYMLQPVPGDFFAGEPNSVERIARILPSAIQAERESKDIG